MKTKTDHTVEIEYWDACGDERLIWDDIDDAIQSLVDDWEEAPKQGQTIQVDGYARQHLKATALDNLDFVENALEYLDDTYNHREDITDITNAMREAEEVFKAAILKAYTPYNCDKMKTITATYNGEEWEYEI
jgi:hypothetical protein